LVAVAPSAGVSIQPVATSVPTTALASTRPPQPDDRLADRAPDADTNGPFSLQRSQTSGSIESVQDIYGSMAQDPGFGFAVMAAISRNVGTADELDRFKAEMSGLRSRSTQTLGNHDLGTRDDLFHDKFGRGTFSFRVPERRFTLLDTASATVAPPHRLVQAWLVAGSTARTSYLRTSALDPAARAAAPFASRWRQTTLVVLASGKVDGTFYGHIHSYYAFANAGIPPTSSGGGGAIRSASTASAAITWPSTSTLCSSSFRSRSSASTERRGVAQGPLAT
jgi:hypothetical protein